MSNALPLPAPLPEWHFHSNVVQFAGQHPTCIVVHNAHSGSYHPIVVHLAYFRDGKWSYERGDYFFTIEDALPRYNERAKRGY